MIRLQLGREPVGLRRARKVCLARAIVLFNQHGVGPKLREALDGYRVVAKDLFRRQRKRCAYCERPVGLHGTPIEHFRPKSKSVRSQTVTYQDRYWWLTWTWENLLFACVTCNQLKANHFPLAVGTAPMPTPARPAAPQLPASLFATATEQPLLLDPRLDAPELHLQWQVDDDTLAMALWKWRLTATTLRGRTTADLLQLDDLADEVNALYLANVLPQWSVIEALAASNAGQAQHAWQSLVSRLLDPNSSFRSAAWCMLNRLRTVGGLAGLALPSPPVPTVSHP